MYVDFVFHKYKNNLSDISLDELYNIKQKDIDFIIDKIKDYHDILYEHGDTDDENAINNENDNSDIIIENINKIYKIKNCDNYKSMYKAYFLYYPKKLESFNIYTVKIFANIYGYTNYDDFIEKYNKSKLTDAIDLFGDYQREKMKNEYLKIKYKERIKKLYKKNLKNYNLQNLDKCLEVKKNNHILVFNEPEEIKLSLTQFIVDNLNDIDLNRKTVEFRFDLLRKIIRNFNDKYKLEYKKIEEHEFDQYLRKKKHWELFNYYIK